MDIDSLRKAYAVLGAEAILTDDYDPDVLDGIRAEIDRDPALEMQLFKAAYETREDWAVDLLVRKYEHLIQPCIKQVGCLLSFLPWAKEEEIVADELNDTLILIVRAFWPQSQDEAGEPSFTVYACNCLKADLLFEVVQHNNADLADDEFDWIRNHRYLGHCLIDQDRIQPVHALWMPSYA